MDSGGNIEVNRIIAQMPLFTGRQIKYENSLKERKIDGMNNLHARDLPPCSTKI